MKTIRTICFLMPCFAFGVPSAFAGSDDKSPWFVNSTVPPQTLVIDGVMCHAKPTGRDGVFLYMPEEVENAAAIWALNLSLRDGSSTTIESAHRKWRITKAGDILTYHLVGQTEGTSGWSGDAIAFLTLLLVFGLLLIQRVLSSVAAKKRAAAESTRQRLITNEAEREKKLNEQRAAALREDALRRQREEELEAARREQDEKLERARSALANANQMMQEIPRQGGARAVAKYLRESYLFDQALGEWISVIRIINPDLNGNVEFRWKVSRDMPPSTSVQILRGGRPVRGEFGLVGALKEQIRPGRRASYRFSVFVGEQRWGIPVLMEVKIPDLKEWARAATGDEDDIRERYRQSLDKRLALEELRTQAIKDVGAKEVPDDLKEWMLGIVDSVTAEFQEEA